MLHCIVLVMFYPNRMHIVLQMPFKDGTNAPPAFDIIVLSFVIREVAIGENVAVVIEGAVLALTTKREEKDRIVHVDIIIIVALFDVDILRVEGGWTTMAVFA
eukprot:11515775-Ditylum_brightwellii.AAC.1